MPSLDELKKIAAARAPGEWKYEDGNNGFSSFFMIQDSDDSSGEEYYCYPMHGDDGSAKFIVTAANTYDQLLAIAEAAKRLKYVNNETQWDILESALAALEGTP